MKVWFGTTTKKLLKYKEYYFAIRDYLIDVGCIIPFNWLEDAYEYKKNHPYDRRDIKGLFRKVLKAIDRADFSVIEYTVPNFSSSHQIYYSIQKKKPTLVMRLFRDNSFADSYIEALESRFLTVKIYNLKDYKEIIDEFVGYSRLEQGYNRYNIVLDRGQKYFLDWAANKYKKSRSEILRGLIQKEIKKDKNYKRYLSYFNPRPRRLVKEEQSRR